jgi:hypothetical protein
LWAPDAATPHCMGLTSPIALVQYRFDTGIGDGSAADP